MIVGELLDVIGCSNYVMLTDTNGYELARYEGRDSINPNWNVWEIGKIDAWNNCIIVEINLNA